MLTKRKVFRESIQCRTADGSIVIISEYGIEISGQIIGGPVHNSTAPFSWQTKNGQPINKIDANTFKNIMTNEILVRT